MPLPLPFLSDIYFTTTPGMANILPYLLGAARQPSLTVSMVREALFHYRNVAKAHVPKRLVRRMAAKQLSEQVQLGYLHQLMRNRRGQLAAGKTWLRLKCGAGIGDIVSVELRGKKCELIVEHVMVGKSRKFPEGFVLLRGPSSCSRAGFRYPDRSVPRMLPAVVALDVSASMQRVERAGVVLKSLFPDESRNVGARSR